ncbi:hypothetical protein FJT64_011230 [Amphibalanus amphitrite]|uniref:Uncharacterized protein n=1 Tax=Amphibalanus amphitrite TaxID=1232801 RepID=A0A6A4VA21_AMPAM|nr:hypothetical protein FJT64_011230 [Amphibalanus amphitrite]
MGTMPEEVLSEYVSYLIMELVSDIGGFISLMLGVSALSLIDLIKWLRNLGGNGQRSDKVSSGHGSGKEYGAEERQIPRVLINVNSGNRGFGYM